MKIRNMSNVTSQMVATRQQCEAHWAEAERWKREQPKQHTHPIERNIAFNTLEVQLAAKVPSPRVFVMGMGVL